jgi:hypothetical protein
MKQKFQVIVEYDSEIEIGQIGVPVMEALKISHITVIKCAEKRICEGHVGGSYVKEWVCQTCGLPIL